VPQDSKIVTMISKVEQLNSQISGQVPSKVTVSYIGDVTVAECDYEDYFVTVSQKGS